MITQSSTLSNSYLDGGDNPKYSNLIQQSVIKILKSQLFNLFSYLDGIATNFYAMHYMITIWRLIQILGPCLCASNNDIWYPESPEAKTLSVVSVIFHLIPAAERRKSAAVVEYIFIALAMGLIGFLFFSCFQYSKTAKLSKYTPALISIFMNIFSFIVVQIFINCAGESIGRLIEGNGYFDTTIELCAIIIGIVAMLIWLIIYYQIGIVTCSFRPISLETVAAKPQIIFESIRTCITLICAISTQLTKYPSAVLMFIAAILYFSEIYTIFLPGSFIQPLHQQLICASSVTGGIFSLIFGIYIIAGREASFIEIIILIFVFSVAFVASMVILNMRLHKQISLLDSFEKTEISIEDFGTPQNALCCIITGMTIAHPACISWTMFRSATEYWPEYPLTWAVFAKFVAIYPSETNLLNFITHSIGAKKVNYGTGKQIMAQAKTILMHRESALSSQLKIRLGKASKHLQNSKTKMRHIWDLVIQGNVKEMEAAISNAYDAVNSSRNDYQHLISQYPNNRFVARAYARFLIEMDGDPVQYSEWSEKVKMLQRGIQVNTDQTQLLGLHAFPALPSVIEDQGVSQQLTESESVLIEIELEDNQQVLSDQMSIIKSRIESLSIPAVSCIRWWSIAFLFLFYYLPGILMLIITPTYLDSLTDPLNFMYDMSLLRAFSFQLPIFSQRYLFENLSLLDKTELTDPPESYGSKLEMSDQIRFMITQTTQTLQSINKYSTFKTTNEYLIPIHNIIFKATTLYFIATNNTYNVTVNYSVQTAILDIAMQTTRLLNNEPNISLWNTQVVLNPALNYASITESLSQSLSLLSQYFMNTARDLFNLILFLMMFICIVYVLIVLGVQIFELDHLSQCKIYVYRCLTALPKSVVSSVSESLRVLKKENDDSSTKTMDDNEELSKQEENILKVFASASDATSSHSVEKLLIISLNILVLIFAVVSTVLICQMYPTVSNKLSDNASHLDYVLGAPSYLFSVVGELHKIIFNLRGFEISESDNEQEFKNLAEYLDTYLKYLNLARFGGGSLKSPPYNKFQSGVDAANQKVNCSNEIHLATSIFDSYHCFPVDVKVNLVEPLVLDIIQPIETNARNLTNGNDEAVNALWRFIAYDLYDTFFFPMFDEIVPNMEEMLGSTIVPPRAVVIAMLAVSFICVFVIIIEINSLDKKMKFALSLLLHCPPPVVFQTSKIMDLLAGDFAPKQKDVTLRHTTFFNNIVDSLPASIIITDNQFIVTDMNKATERIFGLNKEEFIGTGVRSFFMAEKFGADIGEIFKATNEPIEVEYKNGDDTVYLKLSCCPIGQNFIIESVDQTQAISYNKLIAEERTKSDKLLSSILPANLVARVQNGEKNISFGVQSATILFLDIVEFTPWCASNTASMVMSTLNNLFRYFDAYLATHSSMTKIKCIGDCYMAAGGIFVEINQPAIHAKEVVEFGQEAIRSVSENNQKSNLSLKIRVGVNTGGPIVAGVLGTEKPTFEILGKAINMAQQMEHHGVPMRVHISRSVYELIYGGSFNVKERGQIEIKNGKVLTYIVEDPLFKE